MPPWLLWVPLLAVINLLVFIAIRGRWGRIVLVLAAAAAIGVVLGDSAARATGLEPLRIGEMHVVGAQLLMVAVTLLAAMGPVRVED
jgi:hypothetical protein